MSDIKILQENPYRIASTDSFFYARIYINITKIVIFAIAESNNIKDHENKKDYS